MGFWLQTYCRAFLHVGSHIFNFQILKDFCRLFVFCRPISGNALISPFPLVLMLFGGMAFPPKIFLFLFHFVITLRAWTCDANELEAGTVNKDLIYK